MNTIELLRGINWRSACRDNMEFEARITYVQMDAIREALASPGDGSSLRDTHPAPVPPVVGWQDISTAPRDGSIFVAFVFGSPQFVAWVNDVAHTERQSVPVAGFMGMLKVERRTVISESGFRVLMPPARGHPFGIHANYAPVEPSHWMPLPPQPAASRSPGMETLQASECTKEGDQ